MAESRKKRVDLELVRSRAALHHVLEFHGFGPSRPGGGSKRKYRCPGHDDRKPSLYTYDNGHAHCYVCSFHGTAIDVLAKVHHVFPPEAIIPTLPELPEMIGYLEAPGAAVRAPARPRHVARPDRPREPDSRQVAALASFWEFCLQNFSLATEYWCARGISWHVVEDLQLLLIVPKDLTVWAECTLGKEQAEEFGFTTKGGYRWAMRWGQSRQTWPLLIPAFDPSGALCGVQFRALERPEELGKRPRFLSVTPRGWIGGHTLGEDSAADLWIAEGAGDTGALRTMGLRASGLMGIQTWPAVRHMIEGVKAPRIIIAFDRPKTRDFDPSDLDMEAPEDRSAHELAQALAPIPCFRAYPKGVAGMDVNTAMQVRTERGLDLFESLVPIDEDL